MLKYQSEHQFFPLPHAAQTSQSLRPQYVRRSDGEEALGAPLGNPEWSGQWSRPVQSQLPILTTFFFLNECLFCATFKTLCIVVFF